jgi:hypothetical protein
MNKQKTMNINYRHPSFVAFLENVTESILGNVNVDNYFTLPSDKKMNTLYVVFKILSTTVNSRNKIEDSELKTIIDMLLKYNEKNENYELAAIVKDITNNFDSINETNKVIKKPTRTIHIDKKIKPL